MKWSKFLCTTSLISLPTFCRYLLSSGIVLKSRSPWKALVKLSAAKSWASNPPVAALLNDFSLLEVALLAVSIILKLLDSSSISDSASDSTTLSLPASLPSLKQDSLACEL
eukprot:761472-Hanusia_phi.AAC.1